MRLLDEIKLENGLTAYVHDRSKRIAPARWRTELVLSIPIGRDLANSLGAEVCGRAFEAFCADPDRLCFQQVRTRNFIAEEDLKTVLEQMKRDLLEAGLAYLSGPHFPRRFIERRYADWQREESLRRACSTALHHADRSE